MTAQATVLAVGVDNHRHGVPADVALDAALHIEIAGERGFSIGGNGIDVRGADNARGFNALRAQASGETVQETRCLLRSLLLERVFDDVLKRFEPFFAGKAVG